MVSPQTNSYLELDFWIPEHKIAFEYQVLKFNFISVVCFLNKGYRILTTMFQLGFCKHIPTLMTLNYVIVSCIYFCCVLIIIYSISFTCESIKQQLMSDRGEVLVPIPCWWDGTIDR